MDLQKLLRSSTLFAAASPDELDALAAIAAERSYARGTAVFCEGDATNGFYVVVSGRVKVYKLSPEGKEQTLHLLGPGEAVGEAAVFAGSRFPAHAEAVEAAQLLFLPRDAFIDVLHKHPALSLGMLATLSRRLKQFTQLIEALALKEAPARFASYLMLLRRQDVHADSVELGMAKRQLAAILGLSPESLSRVLARLVKEGVIAATSSRTIRILEPDRLERIALGEEKLL